MKLNLEGSNKSKIVNVDLIESPSQHLDLLASVFQYANIQSVKGLFQQLCK